MEKVDNPSERFNEIYTENHELKEAVRDFERVRMNRIEEILRTERQREKAERKGIKGTTESRKKK